MSNHGNYLLQQFLFFIIVLGFGVFLMSACGAALTASAGDLPATTTPQENPPTPQPEPSATPTVRDEPGNASLDDSACLSVLGVLLIPALPFLRLIKPRRQSYSE
jgi:hypothetical protein